MRRRPESRAGPLAAGLMLGAAAILVGIWVHVGRSDAAPAPEPVPEEPEPEALPFDGIDALSDDRRFVLILRFARTWSASAARAALILRCEEVREFARAGLARAYPEAVGRELVLRIESQAPFDDATRRLLRRLKDRLRGDSIVLATVPPADSGSLPEAPTRVELPPEADFSCDEDGEWWLVVVRRAADEGALARVDACRRHIKFHGIDYAVRLCCGARPGKDERAALRRLRDTLKGDGIAFSVELVTPEADELIDLDR